jgi:hypothetical protein
MSFYFFDIEFLKYFFRVLHEASSPWLKFVHAFQNHPVYSLIPRKKQNIFFLKKKLWLPAETQELIFITGHDDFVNLPNRFQMFDSLEPDDESAKI